MASWTVQEQEAVIALRRVLEAAEAAQGRCDDADYGSEIMASVRQALELLRYARDVAEGRT